MTAILARSPGRRTMLLNLDDAVVDLGDLQLEQALDEDRRRPRDDDLRGGTGIGVDVA